MKCFYDYLILSCLKYQVKSPDFDSMSHTYEYS